MNNQKTGWLLFIKILVILSFICMVTVNTLVVVLPLNHLSTKAVSDLYPNLFTPAPYTFGIWGLLYLALAGFVWYQMKPLPMGAQVLKPANLLRIRVAFIFSCLINILWLFSWHTRHITLSVLLMMLLLVTLIYINLLTSRHHLNTKEQLLLRAPFSLYFGWITIATIANITALLVNIQWEGFGVSPVWWTILVLLVGTGFTSAVVINHQDFVYPFVVLWAYGGILTNHFSSSGLHGQYIQIMIVSVTCMVIIVIVTVIRSLYRG